MNALEAIVFLLADDGWDTLAYAHTHTAAPPPREAQPAQPAQPAHQHWIGLRRAEMEVLRRYLTVSPQLRVAPADGLQTVVEDARFEPAESRWIIHSDAAQPHRRPPVPRPRRTPQRPPPTAPIPSALDPHTVERAWFRGVKVERATVRTTLTPLGRVCSALPGATVDGMGAPRARHYVPAVGDGAPSIPVPADPPPEALP
ncbi:hypothetical protein ACFY1J_36330 [Streptomyces sp. NPDC001406]|uniref:hypothetical protein n=1 Tax=Streptomyces sp. NPDC001406 TaxID=3364572 RepID=UPI003689BEB4